MVTIRPFDLQNIALHYKWQKDRKENYPASELFLQDIGTFNSFLKQVKRALDDHNDTHELYEIYLAENSRLIGIIEIHSIDYINRNCFINCIIDNYNYVEEKYECAALRKTLAYCFNELDMSKVCITALDIETMYIKEVQKIGFKKETKLPEHRVMKENITEKFTFSLIAEDYQSSSLNGAQLRAVN